MKTLDDPAASPLPANHPALTPVRPSRDRPNEAEIEQLARALCVELGMDPDQIGHSQGQFAPVVIRRWETVVPRVHEWFAERRAFMAFARRLEAGLVFEEGS